MVTVFVPAFNEERNLEATVRTILAAVASAGGFEKEIIIVNDGSKDRTQEIIEALQKKHPFIRSVTHKSNTGLGAGFKEALGLARYEKFLVVPGDNDLDESSLKGLFSKMDRAETVFLFFLNDEIRGRLRNVVSGVFGIIYMATFGIFVQYVNSPCIYTTAKVRALRIRSSRFSIFAEINIKLLCQGGSYCEVPGYRQNGLQGSTSLSLKNFIEVIATYFKLVWEIQFSHRPEFNKKPVRVAV